MEGGRGPGPRGRFCVHARSRVCVAPPAARAPTSPPPPPAPSHAEAKEDTAKLPADQMEKLPLPGEVEFICGEWGWGGAGGRAERWLGGRGRVGEWAGGGIELGWGLPAVRGTVALGGGQRLGLIASERGAPPSPPPRRAPPHAPPPFGCFAGGPPCQGYSGMNRFNKGNWSMVQNSMVSGARARGGRKRGAGAGGGGGGCAWPSLPEHAHAHTHTHTH